MVIYLTGVYANGEDWASTVPYDPRTTLSMARGSSVTVHLRVFTPAGVPYDLNGKTVTLTVKKSSLQESAQPGFRKTATLLANGRTGQCTFVVTPADTKLLDPGRFVYDVWITDGAGARDPLVNLSPFVLGPAATLP
jgi:hypothetical protein